MARGAEGAASTGNIYTLPSTTGGAGGAEDGGIKPSYMFDSEPNAAGFAVVSNNQHPNYLMNSRCSKTKKNKNYRSDEEEEEEEEDEEEMKTDFEEEEHHMMKMIHQHKERDSLTSFFDRPVVVSRSSTRRTSRKQFSRSTKETRRTCCTPFDFFRSA